MDYSRFAKHRGDGDRTFLGASLAGNLAKVEQSVRDGTDVNLTDGGGFGALHLASWGGHLEVVRFLIGRRAAVTVDTAAGDDGCAPLHLAAERGHVEVANALMEAGADVGPARKGDGCTPLHLAIENRHVDVATALVEGSLDVNAREVNGWTALHYAAGTGQAEVMGRLLEKEADVNKRDEEGRTALFWAAHFGYEEVVNSLVEDGADVDARDNVGNNALHVAACNRRVGVVRLLAPRVKDVDERNHDGLSALHAAGRHGHAEVAELLLDEGGADVDCEDDRSGETTLNVAASHGHLDVAELMLARGADVNKQNKLGKTGLHLAACSGHLEVGKLLVGKVADINAKDRNGRTALHLAAGFGQADLAELLIENGADIRQRSKMNWTPLHHAACYGHANVARLLIERGADIDEEDGYGWTALHWAARNGQKAVATLLLKRGANYDGKKGNGWTALHLASRHGPVDLARLLVERGADVNEKQNHGYTALHLASFDKRTDVAELLISKGADLNETNKEEKTALHCAASYGHADFAKLLMERGADVNYREKDGMTAVHLAALHGHTGVAKSILEHVRGNENVSSPLTFFDTVDSYGKTPLYYSCQKGHQSCANMLADCGMRSLGKDPFRRSALYFAASDDEMMHKFFSLDMVTPDHIESQICQAVAMGEHDVFHSLWKSQKEHFRVFNHQSLPSNECCACSKCLLWKVVQKKDRGAERTKIFRQILVSLDPADKCLTDEKDGFTVFSLACKNDLDGILKEMLSNCSKKSVVMNQGTPHPLWLAADEGHVKVLEILLRHRRDVWVHGSTAPDGTTPLIMAIVKGHRKTFEVVRKFYRDDEVAETVIEFGNMELLSLVKSQLWLTEMSMKFPVFNPEIEEKPSVPEVEGDLSLEAVNDIALGGFCCTRQDLIHVRPEKMVDTCKEGCKQRDECAKIRALLKVCVLLVQNLRDKRIAWSRLEPRIHLIGSIAEGTRLCKSNEVDVTLQFKALKDQPFQLADLNACELVMPEGHLLKEFSFISTADQWIFNYGKFLHSFLEDLKETLLSIRSSPEWPSDLSFQEKWEPCKSCEERTHKHRRSGYNPQTHCKKCFPVVTHTKLGPCLIFQWEEEEGKLLPLTIDLIPVFPVRSPGNGVLGLFNAVTKTLLEKKPENWMGHFRGIIERDRLLPESFKKLIEEEKRSGVYDCAIKIIHYGSQNCHVIRPGQVMNVTELLSDDKLRAVYLHLKAVNLLLGVNVKTYTIKKIVLGDEMRGTIANQGRI